MPTEIKKTLRIMAFVLIPMFSTVLVFGDTKPNVEKVAVVNDAIITDRDVEQKITEIKRQFDQQGQPVTVQQIAATLKEQIINNLIEEELLFQKSREKGINITQAMVDTTLADIQKRFNKEEDFLKALKETNLTREKYAERIHRSLSIDKLIKIEVVEKIEIPEKEGEAFYKTHPDDFKTPERVKASHILIKLQPDADETARAAATEKIRNIQKQLQNGEDFAALAKKHSEGPSSANGGDVGYFDRNYKNKPFVEAAFALQPGEISDIVETSSGLHLIQLTDRKPETPVPYQEAKEHILAYLKQEAIKENINRYVQELREKAKIEKY